jgi:hypothetical protein
MKHACNSRVRLITVELSIDKTYTELKKKASVSRSCGGKAVDKSAATKPRAEKQYGVRLKL